MWIACNTKTFCIASVIKWHQLPELTFFFFFFFLSLMVKLHVPPDVTYYLCIHEYLSREIQVFCEFSQWWTVKRWQNMQRGEGGNQIFSFAIPVGLNQPGIYSLIFENLFWQNSVNLIVQEYFDILTWTASYVSLFTHRSTAHLTLEYLLAM